jgi:steroid 5-alpha reductase family enzyme
MVPWPLLAIALVVALGMMTFVWLASLVKKDASIIDIFWGLGFVVMGWIYFLAADDHATRGFLVVGLVSLWGLRLSVHILWRNWGHDEDYRYREMRERRPETFPVRSLLTVFWLQAASATPRRPRSRRWTFSESRSSSWASASRPGGTGSWPASRAIPPTRARS